MKTPLVITLVIFTAAAHAQNVSSGSSGNTGGSGTQSGAATRAITTQPGRVGPVGVQSSTGVSQGAGSVTGSGTVTQPAAGVTGGTQSGASVGAGVSSSTTTGTGAAIQTGPTPSGQSTETVAPVPGQVTDPVPGQGAFVPGSLTTEQQDLRIQEPSGARAPTTPNSEAGQNAAAVGRRNAATLDAQTQAFSEQASSAIQLGGSGRVFFPEANSVITLDSANGVVTVRGLVTNEEQRQRIFNAVSTLPNVVQVNNEIQITSDTLNAPQQGQRIPLQPLQPVPATVPGGAERAP